MYSYVLFPCTCGKVCGLLYMSGSRWELKRVWKQAVRINIVHLVVYVPATRRNNVILGSKIQQEVPTICFEYAGIVLYSIMKMHRSDPHIIMEEGSIKNMTSVAHVKQIYSEEG